MSVYLFLLPLDLFLIYLLVGAFASLVYVFFFFSSLKLHMDDFEKCFPLQVVFFVLKDDQWT